MTVSPRITHLSWGRLSVEGALGTYKDAKLFPGGSREWDWNETGTRHDPGVQPADVVELLDHGAERIILSQGMLGRLGVPGDTIELLERRGVSVEVLKTEEAVRRYNEIRQKGPVGGLFHSTC